MVLESRREPEPSAPALSPPQVTAPLARPPHLSRLRHGGAGEASPLIVLGMIREGRGQEPGLNQVGLLSWRRGP